MTGTHERAFSIATRFANVDADRLWRHAASWAGINAELAPIRMSHPSDQQSIDEIPADGQVHLVSRISLFGVPIDRHAFSLVERVPGSHFSEVSSNLLMSRWTHHRSITTLDAGDVHLTDRCSFVPRTPFTGPVLLGVYKRVFARRHVALRRSFGGVPAP